MTVWGQFATTNRVCRQLFSNRIKLTNWFQFDFMKNGLKSMFIDFLKITKGLYNSERSKTKKNSKIIGDCQQLPELHNYFSKKSNFDSHRAYQ